MMNCFGLKKVPSWTIVLGDDPKNMIEHTAIGSIIFRHVYDFISIAPIENEIKRGTTNIRYYKVYRNNELFWSENPDDSKHLGS